MSIENNTPVAEAVPAVAEDRFGAFRNGQYLRYWLARLGASFAVQIVAVSVGWQIYDLTRNPLDLGLVGLC